MNPAAHLYQLQKKDSRLKAIEDRLVEIESELADDTLRTEAQSSENSARSILDRSRSLLRSIEDEVQSVRIKLETSEASLYSGRIQNPKELQDIQNEIASLKRRIAHLEDEQLKAMIQVEEGEAAHSASTADLNRTLGESTQNQSALRGERSSLEGEKDRLLVERQALLQQLPSEQVDLYERLRKQKRGLAVVSVQENSCSACGTNFRPAEIQAARTTAELVICSSCGRIIYAG